MTRHKSVTLHSIHPIHIKPIHIAKPKHVSVTTALHSMEHVSRSIAGITNQQLTSVVSGVTNPLVSSLNNVNPVVVIGAIIAVLFILKK